MRDSAQFSTIRQKPFPGHAEFIRYTCHSREIEGILLGPPGYTQAFPNLRPGPLNCLVVHKTNKPLASRI
jgi:hypothetical protein